MAANTSTPKKCPSCFISHTPDKCVGVTPTPVKLQKKRCAGCSIRHLPSDCPGEPAPEKPRRKCPSCFIGHLPSECGKVVAMTTGTTETHAAPFSAGKLGSGIKWNDINEALANPGGAIVETPPNVVDVAPIEPVTQFGDSRILEDWDPDGPKAYEVLGELLQSSPAFEQFVQKRIARSAPLVKQMPLQKAQDLGFSSTLVSGKRGETKTVTIYPACLFRVERILAQDTCENLATRIEHVMVGAKPQRRMEHKNIAELMRCASGHDVKWDTCQPSMAISINVHFIEDAVFYVHLIGKGIR